MCNIVTSFTACRIDVNCQWVIKVADFGLAESITSTKDYFRLSQSEATKLPVKWMAPESLNYGIFSEKTDVVCLLMQKYINTVNLPNFPAIWHGINS